MSSTCSAPALTSILAANGSGAGSNGNHEDPARIEADRGSSRQSSPPNRTMSSDDLHSSPRKDQLGISYEGMVSVLPTEADSPKQRQFSEVSTTADEDSSPIPVPNPNADEEDDDIRFGAPKGDALRRLKEICEGKGVGESDAEGKSIYIKGHRDPGTLQDDGQTIFQCHLCTYTSFKREEFNEHMNQHYEFRCPKCDFDTQNEDMWRDHLRDDHQCTPEDLEDDQGVKVPRVNSQGKVKTFKCKKCEFVSVTKEDFWKHSKQHIKPEKLLSCPKCVFVTEFKHHLEYHLRNHFGAKPLKCPHCNYTCVNKSMLNSHMKSHVTVYMYR